MQIMVGCSADQCGGSHADHGGGCNADHGAVRLQDHGAVLMQARPKKRHGRGASSAA